MYVRTQYIVLCALHTLNNTSHFPQQWDGDDDDRANLWRKTSSALQKKILWWWSWWQLMYFCLNRGDDGVNEPKYDEENFLGKKHRSKNCPRLPCPLLLLLIITSSIVPRLSTMLVMRLYYYGTSASEVQFSIHSWCLLCFIPSQPMQSLLVQHSDEFYKCTSLYKPSMVEWGLHLNYNVQCCVNCATVDLCNAVSTVPCISCFFLWQRPCRPDQRTGAPLLSY